MMYSDFLVTLVFVLPLRPRPLRGVFMVHKQEGCFIYVCTKFEADCSIGPKDINRSQNFEIWSHDLGHAHFVEV